LYLVGDLFEMYLFLRKANYLKLAFGIEFRGILVLNNGIPVLEG